MSNRTMTLRYVVLRHEGIPEPHFDLMLESEPGGSLVTFRSPVWPLKDGSRLTALGEHRREYLSYEGTVSGGRGNVRQVASGRFCWVRRESDVSIVRFLEQEPQDWKLASGPDRTIATRA